MMCFVMNLMYMMTALGFPSEKVLTPGTNVKVAVAPSVLLFLNNKPKASAMSSILLSSRKVPVFQGVQ